MSSLLRGLCRAGFRVVVAVVLTLGCGWARCPAIAATDAPGPDMAGPDGPGGDAAGGPEDPALARVLEAFDAAQRRTTTMTAAFTEEKRIALLAHPVVSRGQFYFSRPNQVRWEYRAPDSKIFIITEDMYTAYYPGLKKAEAVPFSNFVGKRLFRFIGVGQSIADLKKYYRFRLEPDNGLQGTQLLVLTPRRKRIQEKVTEMRIWVDETTSLPRRIEYLEAAGDSTSIRFDDLRPNLEIAATHFHIDIPAGVRITSTFGGLAMGGQGF